MLRNIKLIIFDWDDVFTLGSTRGYMQCYHAALLDLEVHLEPAEEKKRIAAKWGQPHKEELRELLKEHPELLDAACKRYKKHLFEDAFIEALSLVPNALSFLSALQDKYILTIATGLHPRIFKEKVVPKFNIPDVFSQVITSYDVPNPAQTKPHPYMVETILAEQGILPSEAIVVGDSKSDVLMAQAAGVTPIVVLTGHLNKTEAEELGVEYILEDVTKLLEFLKI